MNSLRFALALFGFVLLAATASAADAVRVMSFNVRYGTANDGENHWNVRRDFLAETIRAFNPDLLGTQETLGFQRDWLATQLKDYGVLGVGRDDGADKGEMMALYYRESRFEKLEGGHFWLSETPEKVGSKSWDSSLPRMATWVKLRDRQQPEERPILFVNTHFDHQGETARQNSALLIRKQLETLGAGCQLVLTGDFNTDADQSESYKRLFGLKNGNPSLVVDSYREVHPRRSPEEGTFNGFDQSAIRGPRIDWIGVSRDWTVQEATIDRTTRNGRTPSDHFPITAVLVPRSKEDANKSQTDRLKTTSGILENGLIAGGPFDVDEELDVSYVGAGATGDKKQKLDLFLPRGASHFPVVLFVHGGAWVSGDRKLYRGIGRVFAHNGVAAAVISYRLSPKVRHPTHIQDVSCAFAWVYENIGTRGGRNDQIFVCGQSAGGHLTALLATNETYLKEVGLQLSDIRGAIPISGIYDFQGNRAEVILGRGRAAVESASPIRFVSDRCPPFLLMYAESDIPDCDHKSARMAELLQAQHVEADVVEISDRNHISIIFRMTLTTRDPTMQRALRFIAKHSELELRPLKADH